MEDEHTERILTPLVERSETVKNIKKINWMSFKSLVFCLSSYLRWLLSQLLIKIILSGHKPFLLELRSH